MINTKTVKIGEDIYDIKDDAEMSGTEMGSIYQGASEIKMRTITCNNKKIKKRMYFKVLMHEIVHGIEFDVLFIVPTNDDNDDDDLENSIDLISLYIIKNIRRIIDNREENFDNFTQYIEMCESNIIRVQLLYCAILDLIDDNEKLIEEFLVVFEK